MNRQAINLLGGLLVVVIVLLGVVVGVLPRWQQARSDGDARQTVAAQNQTQESLIAALAQQRQQLPQLQAQVDELEQEIPSAPRLDQLIDLTTGLPRGAVLRSLTPGDSASSGTTSSGTASSGTASSGTTATAPGATTVPGGFQELPVTLAIDLKQASDADAVLDALRGGPRLLAIDEATVTGGDGGTGAGSGGATLTVTGRVFMNPAAAS